jgi:uncharacterized membrane protein HdeD (DUF308 family)
MATSTETMDRLRGIRDVTRLWWVFLVTGLIWLVVSVMVLRFTTTSVTTVGVLVGVMFIGASLNELLIFGVRRSGWRWLNLVLGGILLVGAIYAFANPEDTFWAIAAAFGLVLVLMGIVQIVSSVVEREVNELWWLGLVVGIFELLLGFWASQQYVPARAALLILWVGFFALFRGITEIVLAFGMRGTGKELAAAGF